MTTDEEVLYGDDRTGDFGVSVDGDGGSINFYTATSERNLSRPEVSELRDALTKWLGQRESADITAALKEVAPRVEYRDGDTIAMPVSEEWSTQKIAQFIEYAGLKHFPGATLIPTLIGCIQVIGKATS